MRPKGRSVFEIKTVEPHSQEQQKTTMTYKLPELGYAYDALEPHFDARTMEIHHGKHHQAYVNNLNAAVDSVGYKGPECPKELISNLDDVPESIRTAVRNNGGGVANHNMFWKVLAPGGAKAPQGALAAAIDAELGGLSAVKDAFSKAAATRFGSGWAWLYVKEGGHLAIGSTANQDSPVNGAKYAGIEGAPILLLDVWEHSYYLKYQNRRPEYIAAFWNLVNWTKVGEYYDEALKCETSEACGCHSQTQSQSGHSCGCKG
jgi:Fe-Mn family superoxide dismutase